MSLENRLSFEKVVSSISARFVGDIDFDETINSCIEDMGGLARASYILFYSLDNDKKIHAGDFSKKLFLGFGSIR